MAKKKKAKTETVPLAADRTKRQHLAELLEHGAITFDALRRELGLTKKGLEEELEHLDRSIKRKGGRLVVHPALCFACGYAFELRRARKFHAPKRCPECKNERVADPAFSVEYPT